VLPWLAEGVSPSRAKKKRRGAVEQTMETDAGYVPAEYRNIHIRRREAETPRVAARSSESGSKPSWWGARKAKAGGSSFVKRASGGAARGSAEESLPPRNPNVDPALREHMREWRRNTAREQGLPAFVVLHDSSLDELCRVSPRTLDELRGVTGFGERKTELYGRQILEALSRFGSGASAATAG
jgi:superfamily II DNA helicase RecQ